MKIGHIIFLMVIANAFAYGIIAGTMVTAVGLAFIGRPHIERYLQRLHERHLEDRALVKVADRALAADALDAQGLLAMFRSGIQDVLRGLGDEVLFRRSDNGAPITATEALEMLERGDPDIRDFLRDVVSASVRMLQLRQSRRTPEG